MTVTSMYQKELKQKNNIQFENMKFVMKKKIKNYL